MIKCLMLEIPISMRNRKHFVVLVRGDNVRVGKGEGGKGTLINYEIISAGVPGRKGSKRKSTLPSA